MSQFIQTRLVMTETEKVKFDPSFKLYLTEFSKIHREHRSDRLILMQQIIELRIRYRNNFRDCLGEQRGELVFREEEQFRRQVIQMIRERRKQRGGPPPGGRRHFH